MTWILFVSATAAFLLSAWFVPGGNMALLLLVLVSAGFLIAGQARRGVWGSWR